MQNIVDEILTWPRTPSQQQLEEAEETLRQIESERPFPDSNKPTQARKVRDALILSSCRSFPEFRRKALEDFRAGIHQIGADPDRTIALVAEISWRGDSEMSIGVATQPGPLKPSSPDMSYNFGQVPRHPEWTGFSPLWREMKGLYVITAESHWRPGESRDNHRPQRRHEQERSPERHAHLPRRGARHHQRAPPMARRSPMGLAPGRIRPITAVTIP